MMSSRQKVGFMQMVHPSSFFERHKFYDAMTERHWFAKRDEIVEKYPDICNKSSGEYKRAIRSTKSLKLQQRSELGRRA